MPGTYLEINEDELEPHTQLQPYLLDRLTRDPDDPYKDTALSPDEFKLSLARDLEWVFKTRCPSEQNLPADRYPLLAGSAMNFGIPAFRGDTLAGMKPAELIERFRRAILRFEPRIMPGSLKVDIPPGILARRQAEGANYFELLIEGEAIGFPETLAFRAHVDLATGDCKIAEKGRA
jgi:type VI secretion system protein ImpF